MATVAAPTGKLVFELVSPERLISSKTVDMVVVPGTEGLFGALAGHSPIVATLAPGVVEVYEGGSVSERIFIHGGFAEVTADRCVVLAEKASPVADLDRKAIEARINELTADVGGAVLAPDVAVHGSAMAELVVQTAALAAAK